MVLVEMEEQELTQLTQRLSEAEQQVAAAQQQIQQQQAQATAEQKRAFIQGYDKRVEEDRNMRESRELKKEMESIRMELRMQACAAAIRPFSGQSTDQYAMWIQDLEKTLTMVGKDDTRARTLAMMSLTGPAADFVSREIRKDERITWAELKEKLEERYNDYADLAYAKQKLRRMIQSKSESVQNYYERLMTAAHQAYGELEIDDPYVQAQLTEFFTDGLRCDNTVRRIIRLKPKTPDEALKLATQEQQARKAFNLRRGHVTESEHEPMEVDHTYDAHKTEATAANTLKVISSMIQQAGCSIHDDTRSTLGVQDVPPQQNIPKDLRPVATMAPQPLHQSNQDARMMPNGLSGPPPASTKTCYNCGRPGHIRRECRSGWRPQPGNSPSPWRPPSQNIQWRHNPPTFRNQGPQPQYGGMIYNSYINNPGQFQPFGTSYQFPKNA